MKGKDITSAVKALSKNQSKPSGSKDIPIARPKGRPKKDPQPETEPKPAPKPKGRPKKEKLTLPY